MRQQGLEASVDVKTTLTKENIMKIEAMKKAHADCVAKMEAMLSDSESFTDEQQTAFDGLTDEIASLEKQIANCEKVMKAQAESNRLASVKAPTLDRQVSDLGTINDLGTPKTTAPKDIVIPAAASRFSGKLEAFDGNAKEAYAAGQWFRAISGNATAAKWCADHGMALQNGQIEGDNTLGGYLVPMVLENRIIRLVEEYGLFRQLAYIQPMTSETSQTNRRTGGVTAYFTGETDAATKETMSWDQIELVAKKITALTCMSDELNSDAVISVANSLAQEIALAFATKEDQCGFNGTGTSTYGGMTGITQKLVDINGVDDGGGLILAAGNAWSEITLANMNQVIGATQNLPQASESWVCSKPFWAQVMSTLQTAAGGNNVANIASGGQMSFLGYPVFVSNAMPKTEANSQIACLFGDISLSSTFGDRMGMELATSREATIDGVNMFETGQTALKGTERFDINNHDLGTATAGGPVVGLITAAS